MQLRQISKWAMLASVLIWHKHSADYLKFSFHCDKSNLAQLEKCVSITSSSWYVMSGRWRGWRWRLNGCECILIKELMEVWLEHSKRKILHTCGDTGQDSDGWQLVFVLLVKTEFFRKERMGSLSGVKVEAASKETAECSSQIVGCLNTTHSHTTASKKLHNPAKAMFTLLQNTLSGYGGYVYEFVCMCECRYFSEPRHLLHCYLLKTFCCSFCWTLL